MPGQVGGALAFDGVDDSVIATPASHYDYLDLTVDAWIKPDSVVGFQTIVVQDSLQWLLGLSDDEVTCVNQSSPSSYSLTTSGANLQPGVWTHVACTWNSTTDEAAILVDGAVAWGPEPYVNTSSSLVVSPWRIGGEASTDFFDGSIDEVEVFTRGLSAAEVQASARAP